MVITPEMCVGGRDFSEPRLNSTGSTVVYAVTQDRVASLVSHSLSDRRRDFTLATDPALRPARGLGGGAWCFTSDETAVVYLGVDGELWLQSLLGGTSRRLTTFDGERAASSPHCTPDGRSVVFALDDAEIHELSFDGGQSHRIDDGSADFCLDPFVEASGAIRWQAWNVPDMPWDHSRVQRFADGRVTDTTGSGSMQQPRTLPDGTPICLRDDTGWLNVWVDDRPLVEEPFEHGGPTWGPSQRSYAWSPDGTRVAFTRNERGFGRLCVIDVATGVVRDVARGVHGQLSWAGSRLFCMRTGARTPPEIVLYDTTTWERTVIASTAPWPNEELVEPRAIEVGPVHARLYAGNGRGLIVWLHGGPTDQWQVSFMPRIAYWRAQGWSILVPDHRGSTGHGRDYQQALRGKWGVLDVADTLAVTKHAHTAGWGAPATTVIMGASAGGFTALHALAAKPELYVAAVMPYPVTDLLDLAQRSYRYEAHYSHSLIGPLPAATDVYRERSPITHPEHFTSRPILILHGDADPVVPVEQSNRFVARVRAAGGVIELHVYGAEGHGFRQPANQLDEYRRIADFLTRHVPLASAQ